MPHLRFIGTGEGIAGANSPRLRNMIFRFTPMFAKRLKNLRFNLLVSACVLGAAAGGWLAMSGHGLPASKSAQVSDTRDGLRVVPAEAGSLITGHSFTHFNEAENHTALHRSSERDAGSGLAGQKAEREPIGGAFIDADAGGKSAEGKKAQASHAMGEPVMAVVNGAIEVTVPVYAASAKTATVPVALALAADPAGLSDQMQAEVGDMAMDFLEAVAADAGTTDATNAAYLKSWQNAARVSDQNFKMRYGRVAYVQMNLMTAQEAALNAR